MIDFYIAADTDGNIRFMGPLEKDAPKNLILYKVDEDNFPLVLDFLNSIKQTSDYVININNTSLEFIDKQISQRKVKDISMNQFFEVFRVTPDFNYEDCFLIKFNYLNNISYVTLRYCGDTNNLKKIKNNKVVFYVTKLGDINIFYRKLEFNLNEMVNNEIVKKENTGFLLNDSFSIYTRKLSKYYGYIL